MVAALALVAAMAAWWLDGESEQPSSSLEGVERNSASIQRPPSSVSKEETGQDSETREEDAREAVRAASETFNTSVLAAMLGLRYSEAEKANERTRKAPEVFRDPAANAPPPRTNRQRL